MSRCTDLVAAAGLSLLVAGLTVWSCSTGKMPNASVQPSAPPLVRTSVQPSCGSDGGALDINCPAFPNTTPTVQPQWDYFAWNSFIAANWPAVVPAQNNEQRGFPDLGQSFTGASPDSLLSPWRYAQGNRKGPVPFILQLLAPNAGHMVEPKPRNH